MDRSPKIWNTLVISTVWGYKVDREVGKINGKFCLFSNDRILFLPLNSRLKDPLESETSYGSSIQMKSIDSNHNWNFNIFISVLIIPFFIFVVFQILIYTFKVIQRNTRQSVHVRQIIRRQ